MSDLDLCLGRRETAIQELFFYLLEIIPLKTNFKGGGRKFTEFACYQLGFADEIVVNAEEEEEAGVLVDRLDSTTTRYNMEIGPDKTKMMTNDPNGF